MVRFSFSKKISSIISLKFFNTPQKAILESFVDVKCACACVLMCAVQNVFSAEIKAEIESLSKDIFALVKNKNEYLETKFLA